MKLKKIIQTLKDEVKLAEEESVKFIKSKNDAAGTRLRKHLQNLRVFGKDGRDKVSIIRAKRKKEKNK